MVTASTQRVPVSTAPIAVPGFDSLSAWADAAGISHSGTNLIYQGKRWPTRATSAKLASAMGFTTSQFWTWIAQSWRERGIDPDWVGVPDSARKVVEDQGADPADATRPRLAVAE